MKIYLAGFSDRNSHGPGRLLHIMAAPPRFVLDHVAGYVPGLVPKGAEQDLMRSLLADRQCGQAIAPDDPRLVNYRTTYTARLRADACLDGDDLEASRRAVASFPDHPAWPCWQTCRHDSPIGHPLTDGCTLVCTCARAESQAGRCHRAWAAQVLSQAGYEVILDGQPIILEPA